MSGITRLGVLARPVKAVVFVASAFRLLVVKDRPEASHLDKCSCSVGPGA